MFSNSNYVENIGAKHAAWENHSITDFSYHPFDKKEEQDYDHQIARKQSTANLQ